MTARLRAAASDLLSVLAQTRGAWARPLTAKEMLGVVDTCLSETREALAEAEKTAIPLILFCPACGKRHIDVGEFETKLHHTHACQRCGMVWRPAIEYTVGVQFLPGFKND